MEKVKNETYNHIICSNSKIEVESIISASINKLLVHGVHLHIISRFMLKLQDRLEIEKSKTSSVDKRKILNEAIILLKQMDLSKIGVKH